MTYPTLETVNATTDLANILVYANTITNGYFMPMVLFAFFIIVMIGSFVAQFRFSGRPNFQKSFAVSSFSTFGVAMLMSSKNGLLEPTILIITLVLTILSAMWLFFSSENI